MEQRLGAAPDNVKKTIAEFLDVRSANGRLSKKKIRLVTEAFLRGVLSPGDFADEIEA